MESEGPVPDAAVLTFSVTSSGLFVVILCTSGRCGMPVCVGVALWNHENSLVIDTHTTHTIIL